ncbi:MAG: Clp protease N-terminal domain-containing protein, partial [Gemmatimonadales bacterium]
CDMGRLDVRRAEACCERARVIQHSTHALGMLREEKGIAAQVLVDSGLTLEAAHSEILMILGDESKRPAAERSSSMQRRMAWLGAATVESYPQRVRTVLDDARALAARLGAANVEPSHVAIALLRNGDGAANVALERMRSDATQILASLESTVPTGRAASSPEAVIQRSPALQRGLIAASQEQREWGAAGIGTHHLLIGILASDVDVASAFAAGGVTVDRFREEARRVVG